MSGRKLLCRADGQPMRHDEIYQAMGLRPKERLPDRGMPLRFIDGVAVRIEPKIKGKAQDGSRTRARCPVCELWFVFDNLRQHYPVHERAARPLKLRPGNLRWEDRK